MQVQFVKNVAAFNGFVAIQTFQIMWTNILNLCTCPKWLLH